MKNREGDGILGDYFSNKVSNYVKILRSIFDEIDPNNI